MQAEDIINRSLDAIGAGTLIASFADGTPASEAARRIYGPTLRQLLRTAHWGFARRQAPLLLLGDATGQTLAPNGQPYARTVEPPWTYAYAWPSDGVKARWLPWAQQAQPTAVPIMTGLAATPLGSSLIPGRFLVSSSNDFPAIAGQADWDNLPDLPEGQGPIGRRVILTDVPTASLVYTRLVLAPEEWDALFEEAMAAVCGARLAMPLILDKKLAITVRNQQIAIAKSAISEARVANANDSGFPQTIDHTPDWLRARSGGGGWGGFGRSGVGLPGYYSLGWEGFAFGGDGGAVF